MTNGVLIILTLVLLTGCATAQKAGGTQKEKVAFIDESWGYYGLVLYFCDVDQVDDWVAPKPEWTFERVDRIEVSAGVHHVSTKCKSKVYPGIRHRYLYTFTLTFEEGHEYRVDLSLRKGCVFITDVTTNQVVADDEQCAVSE